MLAMAGDEGLEPSYLDLETRVLPLDDPASRFQRYCFHAPHTQHGRFIEVVAKLFAINASTVRKLVMISAAIAIQLRRNLDLKTVEFNRLRVHNLVAARRIELPSQP